MENWQKKKKTRIEQHSINKNKWSEYSLPYFIWKFIANFIFRLWVKVSKNKLVRTVRRGVLPLFQCEQMELFPTVNKLFQFFFFETNFQLYLRVVFNVFPDPLIKSNWHLVDNLVLHLNFYVTFYSVFFSPVAIWNCDNCSRKPWNFFLITALHLNSCSHSVLSC